MNPIDPNEAPEGYEAIDSNQFPESSPCPYCEFYTHTGTCNLGVAYSCLFCYRNDRCDVIFKKKEETK